MIERQLADRVVEYLAEGRVTTVPGIARGVRARDVDVRALVSADPRFERCPAPAGRVGQARCYGLAREVVPRHGTSSTAPPAPFPPQGALAPIEELWWPVRDDAPRSVGEAIRAANRRRAAA